MIEQVKFTSHYVSINSDEMHLAVMAYNLFTSHYVSINSN